MTRPRVVGLIAAIGLIPIGITLAVSEREARASAARDLDGALARQVDAQAIAIENYFEQARTNVLLTAQNPVFAAFYARSGGRLEKLRAGGPDVLGVNRALGYLEQLYPTAIGEACFIDRDGAEVARVVSGKPARVPDLSLNETGTAFFKPTFALARQGLVYQAPPYVSPDTKEWVISNSTLMPTRDGAKRAIVHFEVTIESFRKEAAATSGRYDVDVIDAKTGKIIFDSQAEQKAGAPLGVPSHRPMPEVVGSRTPSGLADLSEGRSAYRRLRRTPHNANDWYVVAVAKPAAGSLIGSAGWFAMSGLAAGVLLAGFLVSRRWGRSLTGIGNHRAFRDGIADAVDAASETSPVTVLMLDLNGLKETNDRLGHRYGDERIIELAQALMHETGSEGQAFRLGGDEFAVFLENARALDGLAFADRVRLGVGGEPIDVTAGIAQSETGVSAEELVERADRALISAKRANRGVLTYTPAMATAKLRSAEHSIDFKTTLATALARAVDAKDSYTRSHCETVSETCVLIGRELGLDGERLEQLRLAGLLHDVGKIGTPDRILQKPGALTDDEFEVMQRHVTLGYRILLGADLAQEADWVLHHHERVDGHGYPDGLAGSQIPLESRVILVADAFEAMTSDRPYRAGRPVAEAFRELERCRGTQFCEDCVDALGRTIGSFGDGFVPASGRTSSVVEH
jgi:diguanylate cyclase (GGDEF)-like protein/putative nucleotidyltransferase with HDIG domain